MRRTISGWFLSVTGLLACPCHLIITLPLAAGLLSGTALGGWLATHQGAIFAGASLYFIGALAAGATLLLAGKGVLASTVSEQRRALSSDRAGSNMGVECCAPMRFPVAATDDVSDEGADSPRAERITGAMDARQ